MDKHRLRTGLFIPPHHPVDEDPTLCIQRDMELVEWGDKLGYDEVWIGEHHSSGYELIASPEIFIAGVAERTKRIMLGTGVVSLPYHHPLLVADRIVQLDHQTRGRVMLGIGPGALVSDAAMLGIDPDTQRDRMEESLEIILRLFAGETITHKSDWFEMVNGRLNYLPYTRPRPHVAIANAFSPNGAYLAGKHGLGLLCLAASSIAGYDVLDVNWKVAEKTAAEHGRTMDRGDFRLVLYMHLAPTREEAFQNVRFGFDKWQEYTLGVNPKGLLGTGGVEDVVGRGAAVVGTPDDAVAYLEKYWDKTGGFGTLLLQTINWANFEKSKASYELFMRYVVPKFAGRLKMQEENYAWLRANTPKFSAQAGSASKKATEKRLGPPAVR